MTFLVEQLRGLRILQKLILKLGVIFWFRFKP